jgi:hypothetical protein
MFHYARNLYCWRFFGNAHFPYDPLESYKTDMKQIGRRADVTEAEANPALGLRKDQGVVLFHTPLDKGSIAIRNRERNHEPSAHSCASAHGDA